eukprot:2403415-Pyramimonas_sp.AAC.1
MSGGLRILESGPSKSKGAAGWQPSRAPQGGRSPQEARAPRESVASPKSRLKAKGLACLLKFSTTVCAIPLMTPLLASMALAHWPEARMRSSAAH